MLDLDGVDQVSNTSSGHELAQAVFRNCSSTVLAGAANETALHGVPRRLASTAASPCRERTVKSLDLQPIGITTRSVHGEFKTARRCLSKLVASAKQSLTVGCTCVMEVDLLWIWLVICKPVLNDATLLL